MKPALVEVSRPVWKTVTDYQDFTGQMEGYRTVDVRARVTGYLNKLNFKDGDSVYEGQLLFQIDPRTYKAMLAQSEATLRQARAHFKRLEADLRRARQLLAEKAIGREQFDQVKGDRDEAEQAVGVARANRNFAQINVEYTQVTAPLSGRISRRFMDPGNLVKADDTILTRIVHLEKMYVNFYINERTFLQLQDLKKQGQITSLQGNRATVRLRLSGEDKYTHRGKLDFADNQLDPSTGTYRMRAVVNNRDRYFAPGLFARVRLPIGQAHRALLVSEQALGSDQGRKFVFGVNARTNVVEKHPVVVGGLHGGLREIKKGIGRQDWVIVNGLQKVREKATVTPKRLKTMPVLNARAKGFGGKGSKPAKKQKAVSRR
jgi:RND family efflux transporter MFP subunit